MNRIQRVLIIVGCFLSAQMGWALNGTVSTTSTAPGSQVSVTVSNTENSETITITVTNASATPSPAPTTPLPVPTSPSPSQTSPSPAPNSPPVLDSIGNKTVQAGTTLYFPIHASDPDSPMVFNATNLPTGAICNPASSTFVNGMTVWPPGGAPAFSWTPTSSQVGSYTVTFIVNDGQGGAASETITITVNPGATVTPGVSPASAALSSFQCSVAHNTITLMFTLTAPAETDMPVSVTVTPTNPGGFPASVTIPGGMASYGFSFAAPAGGGGMFTLTASAGGVSRAALLYLP